jgi:hypothetical protein
MSQKQRLGAIIIRKIRNGAKTIRTQLGELNNNTNVIRNRAKVKCLINYVWEP